MTEEQQKEQFSIAYVRAVAAVASVNVYRPEVDDDSIDIGFCTRMVGNRTQRPQIEAQLKCTSQIAVGGSEFRFPLKIKNYNDLRIESIVPRILILLTVPDSVAEWTEQTAEQLVLRKAAFWTSLVGLPETANSASVTVSVPKLQLFDATALRQLLGLGETS